MEEPRAGKVGVALTVVAFVFLAGSLGALWSAMKAGPALLLLLPLAGHAVAHALRADRARRGLAAFCFWVGMALASTVGAYAAAITISPAVTDDGHPVMPMGQAFTAIVLGPLVGFGLAYAFAKRVGGASRARDWVLHGVFAILLTIAVYRAIRVGLD